MTTPLRRTLTHLTKLLPTPRDYSALRTSWRSDLIAGLTVGIVALPLALGFGVSSGAGAEAGIITAIVAGIIAAVFGGSHIQVSGPTGAMVVVIAPIIATHGTRALPLVTLLAGIIVLVAGALRLGRLVSFIPWPVIEGFTAGIGITIFLQQIPAITGATPTSNHTIIAAGQALLSATPLYLAWALVMVAIVWACMTYLPALHPAIPGSLVAIILATGLTVALTTPLTTIGTLPHSLPAPSMPDLTPALVANLAPAAATIAALAAIESLLSARVAASMSPTGAYDPDRELVGQGLASVGAAFFGGMPATGAIARTAVNVKAGARTRVAAITHALVLVLVIAVAAGPVEHIPLAALAGVLMMTAIRMIDVATTRAILGSTRSDAVAYIITAIITVSVDLIVAVGIGIAVAAFLLLRTLSRTTTVTFEDLPGNPTHGDQHIATVRIDGPLFFAAADRVLDAVTQIDDVSVVIVRVSHLGIVDATGAHVLAQIVQQLEQRGMTVLMKGIQSSHLELFRRVGVLDALADKGHLFQDLDLAVSYARRHVNAS